MNSDNNKIMRRDVQSGQKLDQELPIIGEWYWVTHHKGDYGDVDYKPLKKDKEILMCCNSIGSNHVRFRVENARGSSTQSVMFWDLLADVRPAPEWREVLEERMGKVRQLIDEQTRLLRDEGLAVGALTDGRQVAADMARDAMLPAIRVTDPVKQKKDLQKLKEQLPIVKKRISELAEEYATLAKQTVSGALARGYQVQRELRVLEDKIFTIEVYAGLQEHVMQIRNGQPASIEERITIRQLMLYMDEETLIDFDDGGMNFEKLADFDEWVSQDQNLSRVLPEKRGVVAFRIRRNKKDYGVASTLAEMWSHMLMHQWDFSTYLLIRNGDRVYRIASEVDFSPRLIPLANEFASAFIKRGNARSIFTDPTEDRVIMPHDVEYDEYAEELGKHLMSYKRIAVLIQGLLDRSEVFHPHASINLTQPDDMERWINLVRDEEMQIKDEEQESPIEFLRRINYSTEVGSLIFTKYPDIKVRPHDANNAPDFFRVEAVRKFGPSLRKEMLAAKESNRNAYGRANGWKHRDGWWNTYAASYEPPEDGMPGVDVSWPYGTRYGMEHVTWGRYGDWPVDKRLHLWIPNTDFINLDNYQLGDYRQFAIHRDYKKDYQTWAPLILAAERIKLGRKTSDNPEVTL